MYCSTCGTLLSAELSFCNRCGTQIRKEKAPDQEQSLASSLITAVVLVAIFGLGLIIGGAIALRAGGQFNENIVASFMAMSFLTVGGVEIMLMRQLSRMLGKDRERKQLEQPQQPLFQPAVVPANELGAAHLRAGGEPITSVTENTTRTLQSSFHER
jgi:hypothetical protein